MIPRNGNCACLVTTDYFNLIGDSFYTCYGLKILPQIYEYYKKNSEKFYRRYTLLWNLTINPLLFYQNRQHDSPLWRGFCVTFSEIGKSFELDEFRKDELVDFIDKRFFKLSIYCNILRRTGSCSQICKIMDTFLLFWLSNTYKVLEDLDTIFGVKKDVKSISFGC